MPLYQSHYSQAPCSNVCEYTTERYQEGTTGQYKPEECKSVLPSLLKDVLLHGKQTVKQHYHAHSHVNTDMFASYQNTPNSQITQNSLITPNSQISPCPHQVTSAEYHTFPSEILPTEHEQCFDILQSNLQRQHQQQEYNGYGQNYSEHIVQSPYGFPESSTTSMQYEQNRRKQQTIFNLQASQMNSYNGNNNNNKRKRNENIETSNHNNGQREPCSNNVADYPWLKKTKTNHGNGTEQKRTRQTYSKDQVFRLEAEFHTNTYLSRAGRMALAHDIKLSERQVKIWFQNRRMKQKKEKSISPNNSRLTTAASTLKLVAPKSNNQIMISEKPVFSPAQQVQLQSQQFYEKQYFTNNQNVLTMSYSNNSEDYGNSMIGHSISFTDCSTVNYPTMLGNIAGKTF